MALQPMVGKGNCFEGSLSLFGIARLLACCSLNIFFLYVLINMDCLSSMNEQEESVLCTLAEDLCV